MEFISPNLYVLVEYVAIYREALQADAKLIKQGFWYSGLCATFKKFARGHVSIFSKYGHSVRKHIEEGICLPASICLHA